MSLTPAFRLPSLRCQVQVEKLVLAVRGLYLDRKKHGTTDKAAKRIDSQAKSKRNSVKSSLSQMHIWSVLGTDLRPADLAYKEEEVKGLFVEGGRMPWASDASNVEALQRYHGHHMYGASEDVLRLQVRS